MSPGIPHERTRDSWRRIALSKIEEDCSVEQVHIYHPSGGLDSIRSPMSNHTSHDFVIALAFILSIFTPHRSITDVRFGQDSTVEAGRSTVAGQIVRLKAKGFRGEADG